MGVMCGMGRVLRGRRRGKKNTGIVRTLTQAPHFLFRFALPVREGWSIEVVGDLVSLLGWQRPRKWTEFTPRNINAVLADVISSAHSFLSFHLLSRFRTFTSARLSSCIKRHTVPRRLLDRPSFPSAFMFSTCYGRVLDPLPQISNA